MPLHEHEGLVQIRRKGGAVPCARSESSSASRRFFSARHFRTTTVERFDSHARQA